MKDKEKVEQSFVSMKKGKVGNIEYGNIDFEKVIIEILTSTQT